MSWQQIRDTFDTLICRMLLHWSIILRGSLWVFAAMLTAILAETKGLTADQYAKWFWKDYLQFHASYVLAGVLAWRTYLDQSLGDHKREINEQAPPSPEVKDPSPKGS